MNARQIADRIRPNADSDAHTSLDIYGVRFWVNPYRQDRVLRLNVDLMTRIHGPHPFHRTRLGTVGTPEAAAELIVRARDNA